MALTVERLREVLDYDPETGVFRWKERRGSAAAGSVAGCKAYFGSGRNWVAIVTSIDGHRCYAHKLAWLYVYGEWPSAKIDHRDGDPTNNRISNLRLATTAQNNQNRRPTSITGVKGVRPTPAGRWMARIKLNGRTKYLGVYATKEEAGAAYESAARHHFGEFART